MQKWDYYGSVQANPFRKLETYQSQSISEEKQEQTKGYTLTSKTSRSDYSSSGDSLLRPIQSWEGTHSVENKLLNQILEKHTEDSLLNNPTEERISTSTQKHNLESAGVLEHRIKRVF